MMVPSTRESEWNVNILVIEPYYGGSHKAWADGYAAHSCHDLTLLTLPARFWKWRMQGGAPTLAEQASRLGFRPDLILASDMLNLGVFLGLARGFLRDVPSVLYCHENQLTDPLPPGERRDLTYGMMNWLSMLAADRVFFNSRFHLEDWFEELPRLLKHFPDCTHIHRIPEVQAKAGVLPVGCDLARFDLDAPASKSPAAELVEQPGASREILHAALPPLILWNQRWEYDKAPEVFFTALYALAEKGAEFRVALAGRNYRQAAPEFEAARKRLGDRVVHYGYADAAKYGLLVRKADIVASTAIHEFFGIAIIEAIYGGCFPVLPNRLSYPELIPPRYHEDCLYENVDGLVERLSWAISHPDRASALAAGLRSAVRCFDWTRMAPRYDQAMLAVGLR